MIKLPYGFVYLKDIDPTIKYDIRYSSNDNFIGRLIDGYQNNIAIISEPAAYALKKAQHFFIKLGYSLVIYDAYRPLRACQYFKEWSQDKKDIKMKQFYYPNIDKEKNLFAEGFISDKSSHCRGSTVDISLIKVGQKLIKPKFEYRKLTNGKIIPYLNDNTIFFGTSFDYFGEESYTKFKYIDKQAKINRKFLVKSMEKFGFINYAEGWGDQPREWWHFTLKNEPFENEYFDFIVC